jgi:Carbamoyltransferase C-terminus
MSRSDCTHSTPRWLVSVVVPRLSTVCLGRFADFWARHDDDFLGDEDGAFAGVGDSTGTGAKALRSLENLQRRFLVLEPSDPHAIDGSRDGAHSASHEFMLFAPGVKPERRDLIPAVVHKDGTARVQLVSRKSNPRFHELISCFFAQTGVPLVVNTSFNDSEPIVCTPTDAIVTFRKSGIDALFMDDVYLAAPT